MPRRIQRKRIKGWRMPANTVFVGRPSRWGNPFRIADYTNKNHLPKTSLQKFARDDFEYALVSGQLPYGKEEIRQELRGKDLACWCKEGTPCHADILLKIANEKN